MAEKTEEIELVLSFEQGEEPFYIGKMPGDTEADAGVKQVYEKLAQDKEKADIAKRLDTILTSEDGYELRQVVVKRGKPTTKVIKPEVKLSKIAKEGKVELLPVGVEGPGYFTL